MIGRIATFGFLLIAGVGPTFAGDIVFLDGFESGSTCAWGGACPAPVSVTGTWLFDLDFTGQERPLAVLLHQRATGDLVGYVIGGTSHRVVTGGSYTGGALTLDLLLERPDGDRAVHLVATVSGDVANGTVTGDLGIQSVRLIRWPEVLEERRWLFVNASSPPGSGADQSGFLAVALRPSGELMAGGFAAADVAGCLWACDGGINDNPLSVAGSTPGGWRLVGDHQPTFDVPLVTEPVGATDTRLHVATPGGTVYVSLGPFGAHFGPLTGHMFGDGKPNLVGFLAADESELDELIGDGSGNDNGTCEPGEACAYWGGLDGSLIRDRTPTYVAPHDGEITVLTLYRLPSGYYFDDPPQWEMRVRFPSQIVYRLGHVGTIAPAIADAVFTATGCDPRAWESCTGIVEGTDLLEGVAPLPVTAGTELCQPQVLADPVPGFPGYFASGGPFGSIPWAQMEFITDLPVESAGTEACPYLAIPGARRDELRDVMERDMLDSTSPRYGDSPSTSRWKWTAEATLCTAPTRLPPDFSSLLTGLGGWFERSGAGTVRDEALAFVRMFPDTTVFDPGNYDPATQLLITRQRNFGSWFNWTMPDMSVVEAFYPAGELRELDGDSFLVMWRELGWTAGDLPVYQRAAYRLDENGLTIRWGPFAADPASAVQPVLAPGTPCDEVAIICYSHEFLSTI
jgi:hypothetical protein